MVDITLAPHPVAERIDQNVPEELKSLPQWVLWKYQFVPSKDKPKKPPYQVHGKLAAADDSRTWCSYPEAKAALERGGDYQGLGLMLDGGIVVIDLDNCLSEMKGIRYPTKFARQIYDIAQSYTEISPSGKGLHIFLRGHLPEQDGTPILGIKSDKGEMYEGRRYITITGESNGKYPDIRTDQQAIDQIYALLRPPRQKPLPQQLIPSRHSQSTVLEDEEVKKRAENAGNKAKFKRLYYLNDVTEYASRSEAHLALAALLAHRTKDKGQIDRIFRTSALYLNDEQVQRKWDEIHYSNRETYGQHTIRIAVESSISYKR